MSNRPTPASLNATSDVKVAAVRIRMSMCSMSGAPLRETDGGFARSRTQPT